jgi:hypothetical protein
LALAVMPPIALETLEPKQVLRVLVQGLLVQPA